MARRREFIRPIRAAFFYKTMSKMSNTKLGKNAVSEIRESIGRCTNSREISAEAARLADLNGVAKQRIYELTKDLREKRKPRADCGKRTADLMSDPVLKQIAAWCVHFNISPGEAFDQARLRGLKIPVELATFQRYMNEHDLNKKAGQNQSRTTHRSFEAARPGEMYQFDISGTKQRWFDTKTRKIITVSALDVSENHPNQQKNRVRVWRFKLIDDFSRRVFTRYYAIDKANSSHVIDFLLHAYAELGVCETLYTDNDAIIKFGRNAAATKILHKSLVGCGGYQVVHHLPGNARATGKIERQHQESEKSEKLIGLFLAEGRTLTLEDLQRFAVEKDAQYNNTRHRSTGETPMARWNSRPHIERMINYEILKSAFLTDRYEIKLQGDLSFSLQGQSYQLPTDQEFQNLFERQQNTREKLHVIFASHADFFTLIDFDLNEYDIPKIAAAPDAAGDFKSTAESKGERNRKELKKFAKEQAKRESERHAVGIESAPIVYFDTDQAAAVEQPKTASQSPQVLQFPTPTLDVTEQIAAELPRRAVAESYAGNLLTFVAAVRQFRDQFIEDFRGDEDAGIAACKEFLDTVFPTRDDRVTQSEIEAALRENDRPQRILRAV